MIPHTGCSPFLKISGAVHNQILQINENYYTEHVNINIKGKVAFKHVSGGLDFQELRFCCFCDI